MKDSLAQTLTRAETSEKITNQLKEALREAKNGKESDFPLTEYQESASLKETVEKEAKLMREKRFCTTFPVKY